MGKNYEFEVLLSLDGFEFDWAARRIPKGTFEATAGAFLSTLLSTPGGESWWRKAKHIGFPPGFVMDVDAVLAKV